jgi:hypothetical protein
MAAFSPAFFHFLVVAALGAAIRCFSLRVPPITPPGTVASFVHFVDRFVGWVVQAERHQPSTVEECG